MTFLRENKRYINPCILKTTKLLRKNKEDLSKWRTVPYSWIRRLNNSSDVSSPQVDL